MSAAEDAIQASKRRGRWAVPKEPTDSLMIPLGLQCKLVSIIVHVEEGSGPDGHTFDWTATRSLLADPEVQEWVTGMMRRGLAPVPRSRINRNMYAGRK